MQSNQSPLTIAERRLVAGQFYGDRVCVLVDPLGHSWTFATHIEDVSPEEMEKRAAAQHTPQE